jgi:hypothetical protein
MKQLLTAILRSAERLSNEAFYQPRHNHGVTQAYALLVVALMFPDAPRASVWADLAKARLEGQIEENVSKEGLHREHSPFYHFYVLGQFASAYQFANAYGMLLSDGLLGRLGAMLRAGSHLVKPNGSLVAFGDSARRSPILVDKQQLAGFPQDAVAEYVFATTKGSLGSPPRERSVIFPHGGIATMRGSWDKVKQYGDTPFVAFRLSNFPTSHIHRDAFSFELYAYGEDLIVDSGGPYRYADPLRAEYFITTRAHNTVTVDHLEQVIGEARVLHWVTSDVGDALVAERETVPGVRHRRAVIFVRHRYLIVLDRLDGSGVHRYAQLFHLSPSLEARLDGRMLRTRNPSGGPTLMLAALFHDNPAPQIHRGEKAPYQAWVTPQELERVPNHVAEYQRTGDKVTMAVVLVPEPPGTAAALITRVEGEPLLGDARISVALDGVTDEILLTRAGTVSIKGRA